MKKELVGVLLVFVFSLTLVSATSTEVFVKTMPYHEVQIVAFQPNVQSFNTLERITVESNEYGDALGVFSVTTDFSLKIFIKKDNVKVLEETFVTAYPVGEKVHIEMFEPGYDPIETPGWAKLGSEKEVEEVVEEENETVVEEEVVEDEEGVTGAAVAEGVGNFFTNKIFYYVLGGVILLAIVGFVIMKVVKMKGASKQIQVKKLSEIEKEQKEVIGDKMKLIQAAEKKIEEAKEDIKKIKNEDRISEARKKIEEDMKELERLEKGKD